MGLDGRRLGTLFIFRDALIESKAFVQDFLARRSQSWKAHCIALGENVGFGSFPNGIL